jgi:hypothetical protein
LYLGMRMQWRGCRVCRLLSAALRQTVIYQR